MRIFRRTKVQSPEQISELDRAKRELSARKFRSATKHFAKAVAEDPSAKTESADCLMAAQRPREALFVLSVANTKTPVQCPSPRKQIELSVAAHHALTHQGSRFLEAHADAELNSLIGLRCWQVDEVEIWTKISEAIADRYTHQKYGMCFGHVAKARPSAKEKGNSVARFYDLAVAIGRRLALGDVKALDFAEEALRYGPHGASLKNCGAGERLGKALAQFAGETEATAEADKAQMLIHSIKLAGQADYR